MKEQYLELLSLTQLYLLQEHKRGEWLVAEPLSYAYFKNAPQKAKQPAAPLQPKAPPSPTVASNTAKTATQVKSPISLAAKPLPFATAAPAAVELPKQVKAENKIEKADKTIEEPKDKTSFFSLEPLSAAPEINLEDIKSIIAERFPNIEILQQIPPYKPAKREAPSEPSPATTKVIVLSLEESPQCQVFLANLSKAINIHLTPSIVMPASKIESESGWEALIGNEQLEHVLVTEPMLEKLSGLKKHHHKMAEKDYLGKIQCLLLEDTAKYLKEPQLKPIMWGKLCEILKPKSN